MLYDNPHFSRIQHRLQASEKTRSPPFPLRLGVSGPAGAAAERLQDPVIAQGANIHAEFSKTNEKS